MNQEHEFADRINSACEQGDHGIALTLLETTFDAMADGAAGSRIQYFVTMFEWRMLVETYPPAVDALRAKRDQQQARLLDGDNHFGAAGIPAGDGSRSRFRVIVGINDILQDYRATSALFIALLAQQPALARREAFLAMPALVAAGEFTVAQPFLAEPLARLDELNEMARHLPLMAPSGTAPRLAAELNIFVNDVRLRHAVARGLGHVEQANAERDAALGGILSEPLRALALREYAVPGTVTREISEHRVDPQSPRAVDCSEAS